MKESGINYFYNQLNLNTGAFGVFYTFENNAGSNISSVSGGQTGYSGTLSSIGNFWTSPGSGSFSGQTVTINNSSGLDSAAWTKIFIYEKINSDPCILFDSLNGPSGHRIGITSSNKPYFESFNQEPIIAASLNNYASKNAISFTYMPNYMSIGLFNWNAKTIESESFIYPFGLLRSDRQTLGGSFTGYMDTYIHLTQPLSDDVQSQFFSGFFARPTGYGSTVTNICSTGITGYQNIFVFTTGVTGYTITPGGDEGQGYYTGYFPTFHSEGVLTGYSSTGIYVSGLSGIACFSTTGNPSVIYEYMSGYAASFGMDKFQLFNYVDTGDLIKNSVSLTPFENIYNKAALRQYSGYTVDIPYDTGIFDLYYNGIALANQGWSLGTGYLTVTGTTNTDNVFFDLKYGNKREVVITGSPTTFTLSYSGQELYLNGVNLVSGLDFTQLGTNISLTTANSGVTGYLSEYPVVLFPKTGRYSIWTGTKFWRDTSNIYFNGVRQENKKAYIEGARIDLLSGNYFNPAGIIGIYNNNDLYWE